MALGGIIPPVPCDPYARLLGITNFALDPLFNNIIPSSPPAITCPTPNENVKGSISLKGALIDDITFKNYKEKLGSD